MSKTDNPLARLQFTNRVRKRAQYEAFEYTLTPEGVQVRNGSHANPEDHEYLVTVQDGLPTHCTCPADARFEGACKHRVAVAIRTPILDAATTSIAADGGTTGADKRSIEDRISTGHDSPVASETDTDECEECFEDFPCWECVRTGKKPIPE
ncbi:SWIM zinc finger family protein [Halorientalis pallida]|uniref:SWIM zinc finger family protein n=1 Tax=Halorientalis pallida TaxID=2479928 RepID=A0A498L0V9_9EURY|nr:SWIM zinc finger family protein [Halorientalis pallida]RXK47036.1 SWIM zinc finger family protein [Halorientalis pallida]